MGGNGKRNAKGKGCNSTHEQTSFGHNWKRGPLAEPPSSIMDISKWVLSPSLFCTILQCAKFWFDWDFSPPIRDRPKTDPLLVPLATVSCSINSICSSSFRSPWTQKVTGQIQLGELMTIFPTAKETASLWFFVGVHLVGSQASKPADRHIGWPNIASRWCSTPNKIKGAGNKGGSQVGSMVPDSSFLSLILKARPDLSIIRLPGKGDTLRERKITVLSLKFCWVSFGKRMRDNLRPYEILALRKTPNRELSTLDKRLVRD